jgi:type IV secretory pathway protease TraF
VTVNGHPLPNSGQIMRDHLGRPVLTRPFGTYFLAPDQIWLYGTNSHSLDSRKFGPLSAGAVREHALALFKTAALPDLPAIVHHRELVLNR